ncbi:transporter [Vibrio agarivorans]
MLPNIFVNRSFKIATLFLISSAGSMSWGSDEARLPGRAQDVTDVIQRSGILTPKGKWSFDASMSYTQNSAKKVSVVGYTVLPTLLIGLIEVSDADRTTLTLGLTTRYGLTDATEIELRLPYVYRDDSASARLLGDGDDGQNGALGEFVDTSVDGGGLGDIELAVRHQFNFNSTPYWIGGLRVKSNTGKSPYDVSIGDNGAFTEAPTGSGFWSVEPSLSMIYPTAPAVLFANVGYIYNFEDDVTVSGEKVKVGLGDTISVGAGIGFAINPELSFNLGWSHKTILKSELNGSTTENAKALQLDYFNFGFNYAYSPRSSINISAQAGLTEDAPDFQLTLRVPFNF